MKIRKKIFVVLLMLCMVFQMLPNPVFADTISDNGIIYNGPTRICPNCDFTFSCTTSHRDENGAITPAITISVPNDDGFMQPYKINGSVVNDIYSAIVSKDIYSESTYFSVSISFRGELNGQFYWFSINTIYISVGHIDDNFDHMCDDCGEKISDHIDNDRDHYCDTCKVKTSCSGGTATCNAPAICEICNQPYGDVNPTNHVGDANKDHICDVCGEVMSECSGGTATCNAQAICATCGQPYGDVNPTNHAGKIEAYTKKASCTEDGYETYWRCGACKKLFSDANGTIQIESPVVISAPGHKDANKDHSCDVCGEVMSECSGGTATCKDKAICEICGKPYGDFDLGNHVGGTEIRDAKEATCTEDGYEGDTYCKGCETKLSSGEPIAALGHKDANKDHSCDVCGEEVGEHIDADHDHKCDYGCAVAIGKHEDADLDHKCDYGCEETIGEHIDADHDHKCDYGCSVAIGEHKAGEGKHTCDYCGEVMSECSGGTATCKYKAICEICGEAYGEVDPTNHMGGTEIRDAKEATCTEDGYEGDTYCKGCETKLSSGEPIAALGHKDANKDHSCDVCGEEVGEHKAGKGKHTCDYCGAVMSECSGGTATCKDKAICEICGKPYGEKDPTNHVGDTEIRDAKEATCTEDGYEGDTYCKGCETKLSSGEPITALGHKDANKDHSCDVCGEEVGEHIDADHDHKCDYGCAVAIGKHEDADKDHKCDYGCSVAIGEHKAGEGKHTCDYCGEVMSECSGGTATCKDKAICEICGKPYGDFDLTNHVGDTEIRDAKEATCTEDGYEGDTYCKSCNTKLSSGEPITALGHNDANKDHSCDVCNVKVGEHKAGEGKHTCDYCGEVMSKCSGGIATCKDKAICEICGKPYGKLDPTNHVGGTEIRDAKEATCTEDGYEGDTYCKSCNTKLSSGELIAALGHKDANKDHSCDVCGVEVGDHKAGEGKHTCDYCGEVMSKCSGGTATCKDKAICEICGKPYGEVDLTNHVGDTEIRDAKEATCTEDGYEGDTYCKSCNTKLLSGELIAALGHKDANKDHSCDVCGEEVGEHIDADHDHKCDYGCAVAIGKHEDADHDHKCDYGCSVAIGEHKAGEGKHTCDYCGEVMSECSGGTATCKDKAICEICGKPYGDKDPTNHVGGTEIRNAKEATCTEDGYEGDIYCKGCDTKLSSGKAIAATGHTYKDEVTKEATTTSTGIRTYTCEKCGDSYTEEIAKLPTKTEPTKPSKPENREEPTKPGKPENREEPSKENKPAPQVQSSKPNEPQKQIEPPKTVNQQSLIEIMIAMFVNGIAVPSVKLVTSLWQLILQFIKMLLAAAL